ncbi:hypothetical protein GGH95_001693, partial [Coemansia sp. RSA 1836]
MEPGSSMREARQPSSKPAAAQPLLSRPAAQPLSTGPAAAPPAPSSHAEPSDAKSLFRSPLQGFRPFEHNDEAPHSHKAKSAEVLAPTQPAVNESANESDDAESAGDDDDEICGVCLTGESTPDNLIVICEGKCNQSFHQRCYGITEIPPGDEPWYCDWCAAGFRANFTK